MLCEIVRIIVAMRSVVEFNGIRKYFNWFEMCTCVFGASTDFVNDIGRNEGREGLLRMYESECVHIF